MMRLGRFKLVGSLLHLSPEGRGRASQRVGAKRRPMTSSASEGEGVRMMQNFLKLPNPLTPTLSPAGRGSALCTQLAPRPKLIML